MRLQRAERREEHFLSINPIADCWFIWGMLMIVSIVSGLIIYATLGTSNERHDRFHRLVALAAKDAHVEKDSADTRAFHFLRSVQNHSSEFHDFMAVRRTEREGNLADVRDPALEVTDVLAVSKDITYFFEHHGVAFFKVMNGEGLAEDEVPRSYFLGRSFSLALLIGWALSSGAWWLKRVGYHELCDGYHAFSSCEFTWWPYVLVLPGLPVFLPLLGLFYGGYGIFCLCSRERVVQQAAARDVQPERAADTWSSYHVPAGEDEERRQAVIGMIAQAKKRGKKTVKRLLRYADAWREEARRLAKEEANRAARELEQAQRQAASALGLWRSIEDEPAEKTTPFGQAIFEGLLAHSAVCAIEVSSGRLSIYMKTIYIEDRGRLYEIGDFALVVNVANGCMENVVCLRSTCCDAKHPYWHGSSICFGDALHELQSFLQRHEFVSFVDLAYEMMTRPKPDHMQYWKEVTNEEQSGSAA